MDNQIKHMGHRIELEEIEHALMRVQLVNQAAVIYSRTQSTHGKLIGFIASSAEMDLAIVTQELRAMLPEYMVPTQIIILAKLPTNQNGKIDKRQLADISNEDLRL